MDIAATCFGRAEAPREARARASPSSALHGVDKRDEHKIQAQVRLLDNGNAHAAPSDFEFNPSSAIYTAPTTTL